MYKIEVYLRVCNLIVSQKILETQKATHAFVAPA